MARKALTDMYTRFWTDNKDGHMLPVHCGHVVEKPRMIWEMAMLLIAMETYYDATQDEETKQRIVNTWEYLKTCFSKEEMEGRFGFEPNLALDDTGWDIMTYIMAYRFTGDAEALEMAKNCLLGAYEHWKDGELSNGLWYNDQKQYLGDHWKSSYIVSLLISALEYADITKDTPLYSQELFNQTMTLYEWVERELRRDRCITIENGLWDGNSYSIDVVDYLYWIDYNKDRVGHVERFGPDGGTRPNDIHEFGSVSALFANMGMAAINQKLYEITGNSFYMEKALQTSHSIAITYNCNGSYINDRDANTNATMLRYFIHTLLCRPETTPEERDLLFRTADNIFATGQQNNGLYYPFWNRIITPGEPLRACDLESIMINATSVTMICGAALLESLGFSPSYDENPMSHNL